MLIFGHYGFPIKTIRPGDEHSEVESVQLIVKVFHFFYIPIFPYAKIWTVKKGGQRFRIEGNSALECQQLYGDPSYPFYAFAGIILLLSIPIGFGMKGIVQNSKSEQIVMEQKLKRITHLELQMEELSHQDILVFQQKSGKYLSVKVKAVDGTKVSIMVPGTRDDFRTEKEMLDYFNQEENSPTVTINKKTLLQAFSLGDEVWSGIKTLSFLQHKDLALVGIKSLARTAKFPMEDT